MKKQAAKSKLEGEGSYSATRGYNAGLAKHVRSADVAGLAKKAARAVDSGEGATLRKAEQAGKKGPRTAGTAGRGPCSGATLTSGAARSRHNGAF
jgi:hypothetical protein